MCRSHDLGVAVLSGGVVQNRATSRVHLGGWSPSAVMGVLSILIIGFWLGMRHATDADHVVAVSTIVTRERDVWRAASTGMVWGLGHTLTIVAVGSLIIAFNVVIPPRLGLGLELLVAVMLIALGLTTRSSHRRSLWESLRSQGRGSSVVHSHAHGHGDYVHTHLHAHDPDVHPHRPDDTPLSGLDRLFGRRHVYQSIRPLVVGAVHGLAGSAAVTLIVLAVLQDTAWAVAYLFVFGVGTVAGMILVTVTLASTLRAVGDLHGGITWRLATATCVMSVLLGVFMFYRVFFVDGLMAADPYWTPH